MSIRAYPYAFHTSIGHLRSGAAAIVPAIESGRGVVRWLEVAWLRARALGRLLFLLRLPAARAAILASFLVRRSSPASRRWLKLMHAGQSRCRSSAQWASVPQHERAKPRLAWHSAKRVCL